MDEHIVVSGKVARSAVQLIDENLNSLDWWTTKHNRYASREVIDILASRGFLERSTDIARDGASLQAKLKRMLKDRVYDRLPGGVRPILYFIYRYVVRLGFLDARPGYYFHVLQGFWYRTLIDAKLDEIMSLVRSRGIPICEAVRLTTGIDPKVDITAPPSVVTGERDPRPLTTAA
jgi:hypothetical protein